MEYLEQQERDDVAIIERTALSNEIILDEKVAFDIGWDTYACGLQIWDDKKHIVAMQQGYLAAESKQVSQLHGASRYVRKWLLLRYNAWKKNRYYSPKVTPEFLEYIDVTHCPVTREELTHGTGAPSDWSVDRINSRGAYACANLVIMSSRANIAKGSLTYHQIHALGNNLETEIPTTLQFGTMNPLSRVEWQRLAALCSFGPSEQDEYGRLSIAKKITPCTIVPPSGVLASMANYLQLVLSNKAAVTKAHGYLSRSHFIMCSLGDDMVKALSPQHKKDFNKLVARAIKVSFDIHDRPSAWMSATLFGHFLKFYNALSDSEIESMTSIVYKNKILSTRALGDEELSLKFDTNSYVK